MPSIQRGHGKCFLSYKRERAEDMQLIAQALSDRGVPVWQDVRDLSSGPTEPENRATLKSPETSSAVLYITRDVEQSPMIRTVEAPEIVARASFDKDFYAVPVAAGGIDILDVPKAFGGQSLAGHDLTSWNILKVKSSPLSAGDACLIARRVLQQRLRVIAADSPDTFLVNIFHWHPLAHDFKSALTVDWSRHFRNGREMVGGALEQAILPTLAELASEIEGAPGLTRRPIRFSGKLALPLAVALGVEFRAARGARAYWAQNNPNGTINDWGLHLRGVDAGITRKLKCGSVEANDLAVLVSINANVEPDFDASRVSLPNFRGVLHFAAFENNTPRKIWLSPIQARGAIARIVEDLYQDRTELRASGALHLFLAAPAGLAFMLGQSLNTFAKVIVYQHNPGATPAYHPMVVLRPSH